MHMSYAHILNNINIAFKSLYQVFGYQSKLELRNLL